MMFDPKEPKSAQENEAAEEKLVELESSIQRLERKLRLTETEKKADKFESNSIAKKNDMEIKRLKMEVHELEVHLKRCQKADETAMSKEFEKHFRDFGKFKGKSAKEVRRQLDVDAIDLQKRSKSLAHDLELKARILRQSTEQYEEMTANCDAYFEKEPTEYHSLQHIRELENEHQKISKYITESEIAENVLKQMKCQLEKNHVSNVFLLQGVQEEHEKLLQQESESLQASEAGENATQQQAENVATEQKKEVRFLEDENHPPQKPSEQESELLRMRADFEKIKEASGASDIQEVENRFLEQKDLEEKLSDVRRTFARTFHDLKSEKKQLDSKKELLQGARCPERELTDELSLARSRHQEQERRKERTARELERSGEQLAALAARAHRLLQNVGRERPHLKMEINPDATVLELITKLEDIVKSSGNIIQNEQETE